MCAKRCFSFCFILSLTLTSAMAAEFNPVWNASRLREASTFSAQDKIAGTHYFYWYDYPDYHFFENAERTDDYLQDHFPNPEMVSFNSVVWHKQELQNCVDAGLDFILPVYWGVVDNYFADGLVFSVQGLGALQRAITERALEGKPSPKIGLFYDTSTLLPGVRGEAGNAEKYDLRTGIGKDLFYRTIRDFFYQVHPKNWACVDRRPLVVLYGSGFAKYHDGSLFDYVYQKFEQDFGGIRPYIIRDNSWGGKTEGVTSWGAALSGPQIFDRVAQIGAGYNDTAVNGRSTPIRQREEGNFYRWSWNQVLNSQARIVLIETWNEMHEGTSICESKEYGRTYIELTRYYVDRFKSNLPGEESITLEFPEPVHRPASDVGAEYKDAQMVKATLGAGGKEEGLWLVKGQPDGPVQNATQGGSPCAQTPSAGHTYMYFSIADPFLFDATEPVRVTYTYWDAGFDRHVFQYDSHDPNAVLKGAYKDHAAVLCTNTNTWKTVSIELTDARFVNRQNGASDFRFAVMNGALAIKDVAVHKINSVADGVR
ncbi:MAG: DUF5010 domain-containing protein [bacterium]|nr:DUF5010 domain-containing protein [bacterium]